MFNYDGDYDSFKLGFLIGWRTGGKRTRLPLTALTSGDDFDIQKIADIENLTACSIACKKEHYGNAPEAIYIAYIADGVARIKTALHKSNISSHVWQDTGFSTSAVDVSIAFDGKMPRTHGHVEFLTDSRPYVFWVTSSGELKVSILGFLGEMILANENCTKVSAIRATQSDIISDDFGLVVFFIINGQIYYRQHIKGVWYDAVPLSAGPSEVTYTDIRAFRTWDYRIGVQAKTSSGDVYEIFSQFQGIGKNDSEHLEIVSVSAAGTLSAVTYHDTRSNPEHLEITSVAVIPALYGGFYLTGAPQIISAYNIEDSQHDWGKTAVFVFDRHLVAAEVAAQPSTFSIVDSRNTTFVAQTASLGSDGKSVTLTFIDFNAARGTCTANYTPGTVTSMAGTTLTATSLSWTPVNLVAPQIPAPEVYSIENVGYQGTGIKRVRFYSTDGQSLLETEYVNYGDDTSYGSSEVWALTPLNGIGVPDITENVTTDLDLYLARWRVRYYNYAGSSIINSEYVIDGEDAVWGYGRDWSTTAGGDPSSSILENVSDNIDVYSCVSYTPLEYIQTSGTQYINTLVPARTQLRVEVDVQCVQNSGGPTIIGGNASGESDALYLGYNWNSSYNSYYLNPKGGWIDVRGMTDTLRHTIIVSFENGTMYVSKDGTIVYSSALSASATTSPNTLFLFRRPNGTYTASVKLYGLKIYDYLDGGSLIRDFRPALDGNGIACLYDEVAGTFYYNLGSGNFIIPSFTVSYYSLDGSSLIHQETVSYGQNANWTYGDCTWALSANGETDVHAQLNITADRSLYYTGSTPKFFEVYMADGSGYTTDKTGQYNNSYLVAYFDDNMAHTYSINGVSETYSVIAAGQQETLATTKAVTNPGPGGSRFITSHYDSGSYISVVGGWVNVPSGGTIYEQAANGTQNTIPMNSAHDTLYIFVGGCAGSLSGKSSIVINGTTYTINNIGTFYGGMYGMYGTIIINSNQATTVSVTWPASCTNYLSIIGLDN